MKDEKNIKGVFPLCPFQITLIQKDLETKTFILKKLTVILLETSASNSAGVGCSFLPSKGKPKTRGFEQVMNILYGLLNLPYKDCSVVITLQKEIPLYSFLDHFKEGENIFNFGVFHFN